MTVQNSLFSFAVVQKSENEKKISVSGKIPAKAEFFQDHFPGFPVLPGVLSFQIMKQSIEQFYNCPSSAMKIKKVSQAKFSRWLKPGESYEASLLLIQETGAHSTWDGRILHEGQNAVSAKIEVELNS